MGFDRDRRQLTAKKQVLSADWRTAQEHALGWNACFQVGAVLNSSG
jgi:hypothetical protein